MAPSSTASLDSAPPAPGPDEIQPVANERLDRIATGTVTVVPFLALGLVCWQLWERALNWHDVVVFLILYAITGLGITVGFHRLLTHRSFKTKRWVRATFAASGSAAIEGPVISWVADHRKHHAYADREGDPHSPHVDHGVGWRGALRGLAHAHVGWLFMHDQRGVEGALRTGPHQGPGDPLRGPHLPPVGGGRPDRAVRAGLRAGRLARRRG